MRMIFVVVCGSVCRAEEVVWNVPVSRLVYRYV